MSEKLKGDTSRQTANTIATVASAKKVPAPPIITNPLLSAAVTGISLDDFPNKPLLLPPVAISRESKSLVTVGNPTDVDTESLDEINLNATSDESSLTTSTDPNANPVWDASNTTSDSILSQAASSFSALPSVASSVFSTFSKRISEYSGATSRERTPISDNNDNTASPNAQQLEIQPSYIQQLNQTQPQNTSSAAPQFYYQPQPFQSALQPPLQQSHQQIQHNPLQQPLPTAFAPSPRTAALPSAVGVPPALAAVASPASAAVTSPASAAVALPPSAAVTPPPPILYQPSAILNPTTSHSPALQLASTKPSSESAVNNNLPPPEPPKFYTPTEVPTLPSISATAPPSSGQNTYRLSARKKIYAPIPGLSDQTSRSIAPAIDPLTTATPIQPPLPTAVQQSDPYGYAVAGSYDQQYLPLEQQPSPYTKPEERKGGLFSNITNLVPTGVLQNISGLVQSAAGTFTQTTKTAESTAPETYSIPSAYQPTQTPIAPSAVNYFGTPTAPPSAQHSTALATPVLYPSSIANNQSSNSGALVPPSVNAFAHFQKPAIANSVQDSTLTASTLFTPAAEVAAHPTQSTTALPPPPASGFIAAPPKSATPDSVKLARGGLSTNTPVAFFDPTQQSVVTPTALFQPTPLVNTPVSSIISAPPNSITPEAATNTPIQFFDPTKQPVAGVTPHSFFNPSTPLHTQVPPASISATTSIPFNADQPKVTALGTPAAILPESQQQATVPLIPTTTSPSNTTNLFQPLVLPTASLPPTTNVLNLNQPEIANAQSEADPLVPTAVPTALYPPAVGTHQQPPPPPAAGGAASFRLQKGTRHYKSPLTSAETAPFYGVPAADVTQPQATSQTFFNPFSPPTAAATNTAANTFTQVPNYFIPQVTASQSVGLFAPGQAETEEKKSTAETSSYIPFGSVVSEPQTDLNNFTAEISQVSPSPTTLTTDSEKVEQPAAESIDETITAEDPITLFEQQTIEAVLPETVEPNLTESECANSELQTEFANSNSEEADSLEKTLQQFSLTESKPVELVAPVALLPPPTSIAPTPSAPLEFNGNPFQNKTTSTADVDKETAISTATLTATQTTGEPKLANFFADAFGVSSNSAQEFHLFTSQQSQQPQEPVNAFVAAPLVQTVPSAAGFFSEAATIPEPIFEPQQQFPALPAQCGIAPPPLAAESQQVLPSELSVAKGIPPPLGFDNLITQSTTVVESGGNSAPLQAPPVKGAVNAKNTESNVTSALPNVTSDSDIVNTFSNYFNQNSNFATENLLQQQQKQQPQVLQHSSSALFFDTFAPNKIEQGAEVKENLLSAEQQQAQQQLTTAQSNEDQRLQYFFNNPPPKENSAGIGDLNYDLVHSGLAIRNLPTRSLTPISNFVEPPSSACSEFSELNSSVASAKVPPTEAPIKANLDRTLNVEAQAETENISNTAEKHFEDLPDEVLQELRMANVLIGEKAAASAPPATVTYAPAVKHWFFKRPYGCAKSMWVPFSHFDSALLETTLTMGDGAPNIVGVEGGRYDVNIHERTKTPVYWEGTPIEVRRCSWFYKGSDSKYVPYEEMIADLLESEYKQAVESGEWHKKIMLSMGEYVNFHGPTVMVHFQQQQNTDAWGGTSQITTRPRVVKRDLEDFAIEQGESQRVDHLLFMVHGIGSACDLKMRSVEEVVDDFRSIAQQLVQSHYKNSTEIGLVGRVEVLPISWHSHLHSEEMGIDEKLRSITLESIPKLRNFTNDTLLDVLFYTSPTFCQKIMNTVATSMNEVYCKYRQRHPDFNGGVSLAGHSLGSLILFDLLCHQNSTKECEDHNMENPDQFFLPTQATTSSGDSNQTSNVTNNGEEIASQQISYTMGPAGTGQPFIHYTQLAFEPKKFFALGSPIGMFVTIRGIDKLGLDFRLPTCSGFYNIFHPFDPVAYRIEALVNPDLSGAPPVLIPHHKGRKRMHLELKETMTRVGADLKQRFIDTFKNTLDTVNFLSVSARSKTDPDESMKSEVDKVLSMQMRMEQDEQATLNKTESSHSQASQMSTGMLRTRTDSSSTIHSDDMVEIDLPLGKLNDSKRVDYVLQEAPLEFFNEYIFALSSHVCYWESEDTILFVMKEIYSGLGIAPDSQVPQQTMTIERPSSRTGATPTLLSPISEKQ